ncbi:MAG: DUF1080 domain-containing protein [Pirellulales bacterium]
MKWRTIVTFVIFAGMACASNVVLLGDEMLLFDGKTLDGWTTLDGRPIMKGWEVVNGMIRLDPRQGRAGHIITRREFGDFKLSFEWKIAAGGNSGLKYRVRSHSGKLYGCEYQLLDDDGYGKKFSARQSAGALYDLYEPNNEKQLLPAGQFNSSRIVVQGNKIQHWLNGRLIVSATVGDDDWRSRVAASKFADLNEFGQNSYGRIMLTDHGSEVWFRNFEFEPLSMKDRHH